MWHLDAYLHLRVSPSKTGYIGETAAKQSCNLIQSTVRPGWPNHNLSGSVLVLFSFFFLPKKNKKVDWHLVDTLVIKWRSCCYQVEESVNPQLEEALCVHTLVKFLVLIVRSWIDGLDSQFSLGLISSCTKSNCVAAYH